jgi:hypothetical protein
VIIIKILNKNDYKNKKIPKAPQEGITALPAAAEALQAMGVRQCHR